MLDEANRTTNPLLLQLADRTRGALMLGREIDAGRAAEELLEALKADSAPVAPAFELRGVADIFAKLGPIDWLCEGLEMCPGAPSLWAGYGFSGKTLAAQYLALCVASGRDFGNLRVKRGKVLHLDYEQGSRLTFARYQRLARGIGIWSQDLESALSVVPLPSLSLSNPGAEGAIRKACEGHALCIIDSFRAACPDIDENSSEARKPLDMLNRVSETTGCTFLLIHHARKPQGEGGKEGGQRMTIRGSSGFYDACASAFVFGGAKGQPTRLYHEKARITGQLRDDMLMAVSDADGGGLEIEISSAPEAVASGSVFEGLAGPIQAYVSENPGCSLAALRAKLGRKKNHIQDTVRAMLDDGLLADRSSGRNGVPMALHVAGEDDAGPVDLVAAVVAAVAESEESGNPFRTRTQLKRKVAGHPTDVGEAIGDALRSGRISTGIDGLFRVAQSANSDSKKAGV